LFVEQLESLSMKKTNIETFFPNSNRKLQSQTAEKSPAEGTESQVAQKRNYCASVQP
jgi:hypothetical protein